MKFLNFALGITFIAYATNVYGAEAGMPQLNPEFWIAQVFWLIIIFISLYVVVWKLFLPRITYSIENRKSKIVNDLDEAQKLKEKAEKKLDEYNKIIEQSKKEAKKIIDESRKKLDKDIENKRLKFNAEIEKELLACEKEIKDLKKSSISNIKSIAKDTSSEVIKKITNIEINKSSVSAIVDEVVKNQIEKSI
tara:strand:+ start:116 stop:694 length:579 start_codon:yes stop_codon:yes gene_type:complete